MTRAAAALLGAGCVVWAAAPLVHQGWANLALVLAIAALIAYLLVTHLAESDASPGALRPQVRVLAVGAGLLALGAGAAMLPATGPGAGSALLRLVAAGALIAAAAHVLPFVAPHQ